MKYKERDLYVIKGDVTPLKIVGQEEAYLLTTTNSFLLKKVMQSNTLLLSSNSLISNIPTLLEPVKHTFDLEKIYLFLNQKNECSCEEIKDKFILGNEDLKKIIKILKLTENQNKIEKLKYKKIRSMLCYMQSLNMVEGSLSEFYPEYLCEWMASNFTGSVEEIGCYLMLECYEENNFINFKERWRECVVGECDTKKMLEYFKTVYVPDAVRSAIRRHV